MDDRVTVRVGIGNKKRLAAFGQADESMDIALARVLDIAEKYRGIIDTPIDDPVA